MKQRRELLTVGEVDKVKEFGFFVANKVLVSDAMQYLGPSGKPVSRL